MSAAVKTIHKQAVSSQKDYNHATDSYYEQMRSQAHRAQEKRAEYSSASQAAYKAGNGAEAKRLSELAHKQQTEAEEYNRKAAEYVFRENNADSAANEIDLHGLYLKEAEYYLKMRLNAAISRGDKNLEVIVGKGLHSQNGIAKLKPAVEELCQESNLRYHVDPKNAGVIVIDLQGTTAQIPVENKPYASGHAPQVPYSSQQQPQKETGWVGILCGLASCLYRAFK